MSSYNASYSGIGELLKSPMVEAEMLRRAEKVKVAAESTARVSYLTDDPGEYKRSFHADSGVREDRAFGRVYNTAIEAIWEEYGRDEYTTERTAKDGTTYTVTVGAMAGQRTLGRALFTAAGD